MSHMLKKSVIQLHISSDYCASLVVMGAKQFTVSQ